MVTPLRSRGLPPMRQQDPKPGFPVEQLHRLLRETDKDKVFGGNLKCVGPAAKPAIPFHRRAGAATPPSRASA